MTWKLTLFAVFAGFVIGCANEQVSGCEESTSKINSVEDRGPLSFSLEDALADLDLTARQVTWLGPEAFSGNVTETDLVPDVAPEDIRAVLATRNDVESDWVFECGTRIEADVTVHLSTEDGALDVRLEGTVAIAEERQSLFISAEGKASNNQGTLTFSEPPDLYSLNVWAERGTLKLLELNAFWKANESEDPGQKSSQSIVRLFAIEPD